MDGGAALFGGGPLMQQPSAALFGPQQREMPCAMGALDGGGTFYLATAVLWVLFDPTQFN